MHNRKAKLGSGVNGTFERHGALVTLTPTEAGRHAAFKLADCPVLTITLLEETIVHPRRGELRVFEPPEGENWIDPGYEE